jgi:uncharacterized membrane protein
MNFEPNSNWEKKLQDLETQINESTSNSNNMISKIRNWFISLPIGGKIVITLIGGIFTLSLLKIVFSLISLVVSLTVLSVIIYVGYKVFIAKNNSNN